MSAETDQSLSLWFTVRLTLLAWLSMIGFDFFLHAGLLARLYGEPSPFLLPPERAFALIPLGYLSFLGLAVLLTWLLVGLGRQGWRQGALFGLQLGLLAWGAFALGLFSISTASPALLLGWFLGQTAELAVAGMVTGHGLATRRLGRLFVIVLIGVVVALVAGIVLQNLVA